MKLYTLQFWLLCASHALFGASFTMIIPELPSYLSSLGGADHKGWIIALFTIMAAISRPFSGKLSDTVGRMPVMIFGTLVCVVCSAMYPLLPTVAGFLILRFLHGFSTGFKPTASTAYLADIVPANRRGEAMGVLGVSMNLGVSASPPVGSWIAGVWGLDTMFYTSSGMAFLSILILLGMKETLQERQPFSFSLLKVSRHDIVDPRAFPPAIVTMLIYFCYGTLLTIVPDQSEWLGMSNKAIFFSSLTLASVAARLFAGRASDRYGRVGVIKVSTLLVSASLLVMGLGESVMMIIVGASLVGFSTGLAAPSVFAWTIDRSDEAARGRAMATTYIALEIGIGSGALISAWIYDSTPANFFSAFLVTALMPFLAWLYLHFVFGKKAV
ncbi:MAG: MFS transporter [Bacteroidia bacterium]